MSQSYHPPKVWQWEENKGSQFSKINRPFAGPTYDKSLPVGEHAFQLYSLATPNGAKAAIMFEELLEAGFSQAEYDAHLIKISDGDQFSSGFVDLNPNSKIPALWDLSQDTPIRVFESGAILLHLAEKFSTLMPTTAQARAECLSWLFFQVGSGPFIGGGFGHFYHYTDEKIKYAIDRYAMETKRLLDVLDRQLKNKTYVCGDSYSIADIALYPWFGGLVEGRLYEAAEFLQVNSYKNVQKWAKNIASRPAVQRGLMVNKIWGEPETQLPERHQASDFIHKTADKLKSR
ncbi:glutathione-dependent disulfide-bond oxidoreductase [Gayadomonas joobiniege]|uniref:glutathione-dependent disulfide-bond oxidoreductase n=1 Tax=Gayadomonas joobiniege TaxID=1234606 RepID=UPI00036043D8|nr:glutathione-dependent disulfide-bond oxidoreductase [Gayadomonas joobiniege]